MQARRAAILGVAGLVLAAAAAGCVGQPVPGLLRMGYFPNLTHASALYGVQTGLFQERLGETRLEATPFNAGPTAMEALLAGRIDIVFVGPSPTISAVEAAGDVVQIVAGAASGGTFLVAGQGVDLDQGLAGRRLASPALANTQDIALKHWLLEQGHRTTARGGDVEVINAANPDLLVLLAKGDIDAAWLPEPWATRLVEEGGGHVHLDERSLWPDGRFVVTHVVTTRHVLATHRAEVQRLLEGHVEATRRVAEGGPEVLTAINDGIHAATGKRLKDDVLATAIRNVEFTTDPLPTTFLRQYADAHELGYTKTPPADVTRLYDLSMLRAAQDAAGAPAPTVTATAMTSAAPGPAAMTRPEAVEAP